LIFIDVDDTLVLWQDIDPNGEGVQNYYADSWLPNTRLIEGIKERAKIYPAQATVVWSGGGMQYAEMWVDRLGLRDLVIVMEKNVKIPKLGDIVIDDMSITGRTHKPHEWPE
jgi:hypothetical protein